MKKVNICGMPYTVKECEDHFDSDCHCGLIIYSECLIKINKNMHEEMKKATLCHEILHGILLNIGREDLSNDENFVTVLGNAIYATFEVKEVEK